MFCRLSGECTEHCPSDEGGISGARCMLDMCNGMVESTTLFKHSVSLPSVESSGSRFGIATELRD